MRYFTFIIFYFLLGNTFAQRVKTSNVHHTIIDDKILIFYDLPANRDTLNVKVIFHKKSDSKFKYEPKYVSGAVGIGVFSGRNKKVIWAFKKEPGWVFTGTGFYFEVIARKIPKKKEEATIHNL